MKFLRKIQNLNQRFSFFALAINGYLMFAFIILLKYFERTQISSYNGAGILLIFIFFLFIEIFLVTVLLLLWENTFGLKIKNPKIINSRFLNILGIIGAISAILILTWFFILLISL